MTATSRYTDRTEAGRQLAEDLRDRAFDDPVVLGLPRGGLPVAREVARALDAPLDVVVVRKIGAPGHREFAIGAIGEGGAEVLDEPTIRRLGLDRDRVSAILDDERQELRRRVERYRGHREGIDVRGRTVLVVDDGVATGRTASAACQVLRARGAVRVVLAVPVASPRAVRELEDVYDDVVALQAPRGFMAVGSFYEDFGQTTDEDVERILAEHAPPSGAGASGTAPPEARDAEVDVEVDGLRLPGHLHLPARARAVVVFAHGSGSSRHSPRNRQVAAALHETGLGTLLFDLLTESEAADRRNVFDIGLLAGRVVAAIDWAADRDETGGLPVGLFGASTGAAAALDAAADRPDRVHAVVSRGGRADMAERIDRVRAPVLLVVGSRDTTVVDMNRQAQRRLASSNRLELVDGAGHLFEGPGQLEEVARLARDWFVDALTDAGR